MPSISDLIKSKSVQDEARVEARRAERGNLSSMRDAALEEITSDLAQYQKYLALQSDNIGCSVGNVALTMFQLDGVTKIGPISCWHEQGRYVRDDAMKSGAKVFVPPKNGQRPDGQRPGKSKGAVPSGERGGLDRRRPAFL